MSSCEGFEVPPLSRKQIRSIAQKIRDTFCIKEPYFPIVEFLDLVLPRMWEDFVFEICDTGEMKRIHGPNCHAITYPEDKVVKAREDIYVGACNGIGRDRLTLAHELGHLILHARLGLARKSATNTIPSFKNSEWQAKAFSGELLMSYTHVGKCSSMNDAMKLFGISQPAAEVQWEVFKRDGLIK